MNLNEAKQILKESGYHLLYENEKTAQDWIDEVLTIDPDLKDQIEEDLFEYYDCYTDDAGMIYQRSVGRDSMADSVFDYIYNETYDEMVSNFGTPEEYAANI